MIEAGVRAAVLAGLFLLGLAGDSAQACDRSPLLITNVTVLTPAGLVPARDVLIAEGRISAVAAGGRSPRPAGTRVVDGKGHTLLPGLIDAHAHFFELGAAYTGARIVDPPKAAFPITGRQMLRSGVTSARVHLFDLTDGPEFGTQSQDDCFPAPRLHRAGPGFMGGAPGLDGRQVWGVKDVADIRAKVDKVRSAGAEWIAVHDLDKFAAGQLEEIVAAARQAGLRLMAQGNSAAEAARALDVGVDSIEYIDLTEAPTYPDALVKRLAKAGDRVAVVPPVGYYHRFAAYRDDPAALDDPRPLELMPKAIADAVVESLRKARTRPAPSWAVVGKAFATVPAKFRQLHKAGVNLVVGTDAGSPSHFHVDAVWWELRTWNRLGVDTLDAVRAATTRTARLIGDASVGRIEPGARGDVVLYRGDLRTGPLSVDRVLLVAKGGVVFVEDGRWKEPAPAR